MSLINDALQRAKAVQQSSPHPAAAPLQFRPVDPSQRSRKGPGLVIPATITTIVVAGVLSWWFFNRQHAAPRETQTTGVAVPETAFLEVTPAAPTPAPPAAPATKTPEAGSPPPPNAGAPAVANAATATPVAVPEPPKPAPPRLQAVIFDPGRPAAIVSGKTVFVGERVREFRVAAITAESVTLVSATETNVLTLE